MLDRGLEVSRLSRSVAVSRQGSGDAPWELHKQHELFGTKPEIAREQLDVDLGMLLAPPSTSNHSSRLAPAGEPSVNT